MPWSQSLEWGRSTRQRSPDEQMIMIGIGNRYHRNTRASRFSELINIMHCFIEAVEEEGKELIRVGIVVLFAEM